MTNYLELKEFREKNIESSLTDSETLNNFHDVLMKRTVEVAINKVESEWGPSPAHFAFFMMGSAGRAEQSKWSDQDHGLIYAGSEELNPYFLELGNEITKALSSVGYEVCEGKVMASNPRWCKSVSKWEEQIKHWLEEESWESLRYFSTFFDSRVLIGEQDLLTRLKELSFCVLDENPNLYLRLVENVSHLKKGVGLFGQLLPNDHGEEAGSINLKEKVFFPYVNSLRLLALKERLTAPSTLSRFQLLPEGYEHIKLYKNDFIKLMNVRLYFQKDAMSYQKVHLLDVNRLNKEKKREIKQVMRRGYKLFSETKVMMEKDVKHGDK